MRERKIVLLDPANKYDALYLDFKDNIHVSYEDMIVCEIPLEMAYAFLERQCGSSFDSHILVDGEVKQYLLDKRRNDDYERRMWEQVNETEKVVREMIEKRKER